MLLCHSSAINVGSGSLQVVCGPYRTKAKGIISSSSINSSRRRMHSRHTTHAAVASSPLNNVELSNVAQHSQHRLQVRRAGQGPSEHSGVIITRGNSRMAETDADIVPAEQQPLVVSGGIHSRIQNHQQHLSSSSSSGIPGNGAALPNAASLCVCACAHAQQQAQHYSVPVCA